GVYGTEITDMHIDGFVKFASDSVIVTMNESDLTYWEVSASDQQILFGATNVNNQAYEFVYLPLTQNNVVTTYGANLGYRGSYVNYYIANDVVLVPTYSDPNDLVAIQILEDVHPNRQVIGVDVRNMYAFGGMVHCLTQQQPINLNTNVEDLTLLAGWHVNLYPTNNNGQFTIDSGEEKLAYIAIYSQTGQLVYEQALNSETKVEMDLQELASGMYVVKVISAAGQVSSERMVKK
ncbi:MAG: agmatine deiminase family protein, partial [Bacteroidota bacterium]